MIDKIKDKERLKPNFTPVDAKPNFTPVDPNVYKEEIANGKRAVGLGAGAKLFFESQPSVTQIAKKANEVLVDPLTAPFESAGRGIGAIKNSVVGGVQDANYKQRETLGQATPEEGLAFRERQDAKLPGATIPPDPLEDTTTGPNSIYYDNGKGITGIRDIVPSAAPQEQANASEATQPLLTNTRGNAAGEIVQTPIDMERRKRLGIGAVRDNGGSVARNYEKTFRNAVQGDNSGTRGQQKQQFLARQSGVGTGRRFGAVDRSPNSSNALAMAKQIIGPLKIDTSGFSGSGAKARAHTQRVRHEERIQNMAEGFLNAEMRQSSDTNRTAMNNEASANNAALSNANNERRFEAREAGVNDRFNKTMKYNKEQSKQKWTQIYTPKERNKARMKLRREFADYKSDLMRDDGLTFEQYLSNTYSPEDLAPLGLGVSNVSQGDDFFAKYKK